MIVCTIRTPRPVPAISLVTALEARKKRVPSRSSSARGMPMPWSRTAISTRFSTRLTLTSTTPSSWLNFTALVSTLRNARWSMARSPSTSIGSSVAVTSTEMPRRAAEIRTSVTASVTIR